MPNDSQVPTPKNVADIPDDVNRERAKAYWDAMEKFYNRKKDVPKKYDDLPKSD